MPSPFYGCINTLQGDFIKRNPNYLLRKGLVYRRRGEIAIVGIHATFSSQ